MAAQLAATVYVKDPTTHQTVELAPGTCPEPRLAALVTNPAAWVDGKLPRAAKTTQDGGDSPTGDGQDDASGADSDAGKPAAKKTAASRKSAASKPAPGRAAAEEGSSGD